MPKLLELKRTPEEQTRERALAILTGVVRSCDGAVTRLKDLIANRGGREAALAELGDLAQPVRDAAIDLKTLVEKLSDLTGQDLEE